MKRSTFAALNITLALVVIIVISLVLFLTWDESPPNDADLRLARLNIPEDDNAFTWYEKAREKLQYTDDEQDKLNPILEPEDQVPGPDEWALAADVVEHNAEVFDLIGRGIACERIEVPEITRYSNELPYLAKWRTMARLMSIRAALLAQQGKHREALEQVMAAIRYGHSVQRCRGCLITYLVGVACKGIGYRRFRQVISYAPLNDAELAEYGRQLAPLESNEAALADAFRKEYVASANLVDDMLAGKYSPTRKKMPAFLLLPNQTKRLFAEAARTVIGNVPRCPAEYEVPEAEQLAQQIREFKPAALRNFTGKLILGMILPATYHAPKEGLGDRMSNRVARLLIALRRYQLATGTLPGSLDQLVPKYIDVVPVDLFDGKPIRYDPAKKIIYSVGTDCEDNAGDEWKDTVVKIEF
ncbi:MAG TPA: hypothetical protein VM223_08220 [Planctomycetota bacterium]|nr:hypothetical protein [Planctomycetota bacterium]